MTYRSSPLRDYAYGLRRALPILFGFLPVSITFAVMAARVGMTVPETIGMSASVFAGASQIMAVSMIGGGADLITITIATLVLNLRHIIMSTCVFSKLKNTKKRWLLPVGFGVTDETFAFFSLEKSERANVFCMLGLITVAYSSWVGGTALGALLGGLLPEMISDSLGIALYALFLALIVPDVKGSARLLVVVILTALINCLLSLWLPSSWAVIASTLIGALIGLFVVRDGDVGMMDDPIVEASGGVSV